MSIGSIPNHNEIQDSLISSPFPETGWKRLIYGLFAVFLPALFLWIFLETRFPVVRSSSLYEYIVELLFPKSVTLFFLLVAYSTVCYMFLLYAPTRFSQNYSVRFGVYTGVMLIIQYSVLFALVLIGDADLSFGFKLSWIFLVVFPVVYWWIVKKWRTKIVDTVFVILILAVYLIFSLSTEDWLLSPIAAVIIAAPFWSSLFFFRAAIWLFKNYETKLNLLRGLGILVWISIYIAALWSDIF